ncbi:LOW QUALITY PROTEIN: hypothetical protein CVT26_004616 [Gymnopilus dilepis]|uniref:Uncharacterized protein n=1 Tax=Gymnopilus dilepis TaxID=231916 RepID=A0A409YJA9_9AGAR|nr:LOW QUALITY PROTEIN: hypothetical protein CVT26_004616 [Gymnopilus dilepis]
MASLAIAQAVHKFVQELIKHPVDEPLDAILEDAMIAEHEIRLLLGAHREGVQDLYIGLFDVFKLYPPARRTRRIANQIPSNASKYHILPLTTRFRRPDLASSTVPDLGVFLKHWQLFSHGSLKEMQPLDWNNVLAAGGSVTACILAQAPDISNRKLNEHFQSDLYSSSYIDLFLWGLSPKEAEKKMIAIYKAVCASAPWKVTCVRRAKTITIHTTYPHRPVRISLRLYQSPAEIIAGFDMDSSCFAYDGTTVYANPRALTAIIRQANTVDISRHSPSFEYRLAKYALRGFQIYIPSLDRDRVKPWVYNPNLQHFPNGLAKLLVLEKALTSPDYYYYLDYQAISPKSDFDSDMASTEKLYGLDLDAKKVKEKISQEDTTNMYTGLRDQLAVLWPGISELHGRLAISNPFYDGHRHICFVGSMRKCLRPSCENQDCDRHQATEDSVLGKGVSDQFTTFPSSVPGAESLAYARFEAWAQEAYEDREEVDNNDYHIHGPVILDDDESDDSNGSEYADAVSRTSAQLQLD